MNELPNFPSPHVHVQSLDTASTVDAFVKREVALGTGVVTATDHGSLAAVRDVYDQARKKDLTPILGLEAYFRDDDCPLLLAAGAVKDEEGKLVDFMKYAHVTLHFLDQAAYQTCSRLLSRADRRAEQHGSERKPLFSWADMEEICAQNVTVTTGCLIGMVQRHLLDRDDGPTAVAYYERLRALAPGRFYVEIFPHDCSRNYEDRLYLTLEGGERVGYRARGGSYKGKTIRVSGEEVKVDQLLLRKDWGVFEAVKNYRHWDDREPKKIVNVEHVEGFIENECRPWADNSDVQAATNRFMLMMAEAHGDPVLVSDDAHYATPAEKVVQDVRLAQSGNWRFYGSYHRQSSEDAFSYFRDRMGISEVQFRGWVDNNRAWADRFKAFRFETPISLPTKFYPSDTLGHTGKMIQEYGRMRWDDPRYVERLNAEIELLHANGTLDLLPYFFLAEEGIRQYTARRLLPGPGRGSAAGLLLAYLLRITQVDPLRYNLSLERFLTLDRIKSGAMPDIDMDFPGRDLLVGEDGNSGWLRERFGDHVAQISTDMTLKVRAACKDVCRMFHHHVPPDAEALTGRFAMPPQGVNDQKFVFGYRTEDGKDIPGSITYDQALKEFVARYPQEFEVVRLCLGLARGKSRHASAFVVMNEPVEDRIPTQDIGGVLSTQMTAGAVEAMGGIKVDFLVVNSLRDISDCVQQVQARSGVTIPDEGVVLPDRGLVLPAQVVPHRGALLDVWDLPNDDAVFREIIAGKTETVFQFNTPGAIGWLNHFNGNRPDGRPAIASVEDLAVFTALDRPGPLDAFVKSPDDGSVHNMLVEYARRVQGKRPSADVLPVMERLFPLTQGIMVYQEDLQFAYQKFSECTLSEAEQFRRDVAKKKAEKVDKAFSFFFPRASALLGEQDARAAWDQMITFAAYGFNKSVDSDAILDSWENGPKKIKDFQPGEHIKGVDENGLSVRNEVVALHDHGWLKGFEIEFDDGYRLVTSANHKFLTIEGQRPLWDIALRDLGVLCERSVCAGSGTVRGDGAQEQGSQDASEGVQGVSGQPMASTEPSRMADSLRDLFGNLSRSIGTLPYMSALYRREDEEYPGTSADPQYFSGSAGGCLEGSQEDLGSSRYPTSTGRSTPGVAGGPPGRDPGHMGERTSGSKAQQGGGVAEVVRDVDVAGWTSQMRRRSQAGGLRLGGGVGGGGRVLSLLRDVQETSSTGKDPGTRCDAQPGGASTRCDLDPSVRRLFQELGRKAEGRLAGVAYSDAPLARTGSLVLRRVIRVRSVGLRRMYDLEVAHPKHNFLLPNGIVTSNSHAVCYALIGYVCAWLKHHYPLEWWCAVLRNADKDEIAATFWPYCRHLVDLPDLARVASNFTIHEGRIVAPLSLLKGVGETAHAQIMAGAPYQDLRDFLQRIEDHKDATKKLVKKTRKDKKTGEAKEVEVWQRGRSAIHRGIVYPLLIVGAMDSLLPPEVRSGGILDRLTYYQQVLAEVTAAKRPAPVPTWYGEITALARYALCKKILPAYHADVRALLPDRADLKMFGKETVWRDLPLVDGPTARRLGEIRSVPSGGLRVSAAAYVASTRPFSYKDKKTQSEKNACEINLDIDGESFKMVAWPDRSGSVSVPDDLEGSVVLVELARWSGERPFGIVYLEVIQRAPKEPEKVVKDGEGRDGND